MDIATRSLKRSSSHQVGDDLYSEDTRPSKAPRVSMVGQLERPQLANGHVSGRLGPTYDNDVMDVDKPAGRGDSSKAATARNGHLKGRKRFTADLKDLKEEVPFIAYGLLLKSLRSGDEEGSVELTIAKNGKTLISLHLLIDDTSSYPREHVFYSFAHEADIPPHLLEVVESIASLSPKPLDTTIRSLLASIAASLSAGKFISPEEAYNESQPDEPTQDDDSESDDEGNYYDDGDYELGLTQDPSLNQSELFESLKNHFIQIIASNYKPGLIRLSDNEFIISISCPIPSLAIPPQALVAWDRRLLQTYNNLTLLISGLKGAYPPLLDLDECLISGRSQPKFHVGLSARYKPSKEAVLQQIRNFGITSMQDLVPDIEQQEGEETGNMKADNPGRFDKFSLSASMESALEQLVPILQLRMKYKIGWAGAEVLHTAVRQMQVKPGDLVAQYAKEIKAADKQEAKLRKTNSLPIDPLEQSYSNDLNFPLLAYCYLVRRFKLCPQYCLVCHRKMTTTFEALKPYVCNDKLCTYQYYALNFGPSIEYEICTNPKVVDLLVSLAYIGACEHQIYENLPVGLGLRVKMPNPLPNYRAQYAWSNTQFQAQVTPTHKAKPRVGSDGCVDFDELSLELQRAAIGELIQELPPISKMKEHLERKVPGKVGPQLRTLDENVSPAAWLVLRWCVASSTAYIEEITEPDDRVCHIGHQWRQFRFSVGAPDKEARYRSALKEIQKTNKNSKKHPALYAFHGSALRNWHSIIRQGLLIKDAVNGRAYGHGVYFAKDGMVSMGTYAQASSVKWVNSETSPLACVALAEIINSPQHFTSNNPYYVVQHVDWILCRYLLVKKEPCVDESEVLEGDVEKSSKAHYLKLDPKQPLTMGQKNIFIPEQSQKLEKLLHERIAEQPKIEPFDAEDELLLSGKLAEASQGQASPSKAIAKRKPEDDWKHNHAWCNEETYQLLPPPTDSTPQAALSLQKELRAMLKEQDMAIKHNALTELGWYIPPELIGDNLFRWMIELHSFDPSLPIARDMAKHNVPSLLFEIRFPDRFPILPPFFRIIKPRFLPFSQGGGGHVTIGGSICMDLLTLDGWLPSYNIASVLLQIKLAISNLDPKPARFSADWDRSYTAYEALEAFRRVAMVHGWKVPEGMDKLIR